MNIDDIFNSGFNFEIENKECSFDMIIYQHASKAQNAMYLLSTNDIEKGNDILKSLVFKYLKVNGKRIENENALALEFKNPLVLLEINSQFFKYINVFLKSLPSFQKATLDNKHE